MEEGNPPVGWNAGGRIGMGADTDSHSGKQSLRIFAVHHQSSVSHSVTIKPDTKYRAELWYKCSGVGEVICCVRVVALPPKTNPGVMLVLEKSGL